VSDDDDRPYEREKKSFSELDRIRREGRPTDDHEPRSPGAKVRAKAEAKQYTKQLDGMFSSGKGGNEGAQLAKAVKDAHGTPKLAAACRAYRDALGMPEDGALLALFLDSADADLVVAGVGALLNAHEAGTLTVTKGQKTQLRTLALDSNNAIADVAEELLEALA
jgi:hypothetical protein